VRVHLIAAVVFGTASLAHAGPAVAQDADRHECPMHGAHHVTSAQPSDRHHGGVDERHDHATGVAHSDSVHHFSLDPAGGTIRFEVLDASDTGGRDRIQAHLSRIANDFARGAFGTPMLIHDRTPPGVPALQRLRERVRYEFAATERGGRVDITTTDAEALAAVHEFLRFQIEDHRTGDPATVGPRR
jgi:hypothetical protein